MTQITYYTVIIGKRACLVTYAQSPAYETKLFPGSFSDPGEASQQFQKKMQGKLEYISQGVFDRKISDLAYRYTSDLLKLPIWNNQRTPERKSPMALITNEQYFNNLPAFGRDLAEDSLEQDLATLQENDLPVSDTVAGLLMVHSLKVEQDAVSEEELL